MEHPVRSSRQVDLDQLTKGFTKWRETHQSLILEKSKLQQNLNGLSILREQDKSTEKATNEELKQLRDIITSLQDSLVQRCDLEDENKNLREQVSIMEETIAAVKEEGQATLKEQQATLEQAQAEEKALMEETHQRQVKQLEEQTKSLQESLRDRSAEVKQLRLDLSEAEKGRQTEVVKLRLEYDAKLLKLQSASARTSLHRSDKPSSASSLIFREKMLNAQAVSEREVSSLRQTVSELKRKLDSRQPPSSTKRKR